MNKDYFLRELEYLLMDLNEEEREAALEYYRDYFEEAGPQHEAEMAARLGSPEKVAAELKAALAGDTDGGEFSERGYRDERFAEDEKVPDQYAEVVVGEVIDEKKYSSGKSRYRRNGYDEEWRETQSKNEQRRGHRGGGLLLLILFLIFGLPLAGSIIGAGFSIVAAFAGLIFGVLGGLIGLIVGGVSAVFGLFTGGIGTIISGLCNLNTPAMGVMTVGIGFFMLTGAFLLAIAVKWACGAAVPGVIHLCVELVKKAVQLVKRLLERMFGKRGETR